MHSFILKGLSVAAVWFGLQVFKTHQAFLINNLLKVCPSSPPFVLTELDLPYFIFSSFAHILLSLVAVFVKFRDTPRLTTTNSLTSSSH